MARLTGLTEKLDDSMLNLQEGVPTCKGCLDSCGVEV